MVKSICHVVAVLCVVDLVMSMTILQTTEQENTNWALKRPTWQSSIWKDSFAASSSAVDGNADTNYNSGHSCSHTDAGDSNPWWAVDLGQQLNVESIELVNRADCCPERGNNLVIGLTNTAPTDEKPTIDSVEICGRGPATATAGEVIEVSCAAGVAPARYVVVLSPQEYLTICEFEVQATVPANRSPNWALNQPTWQSSIWKDSFAASSSAVDGNADTNYISGHSCSHTNAGDSNPWWAVDLGQQLNVESIELVNRADCCSERGNNLIFGLTNTAPTVEKPTVDSVEICGRGPATATVGEVIEVSCAAGLKPARYVVVLSPQEYLTICEFVVQAKGL